jgi:hypothetical protein
MYKVRKVRNQPHFGIYMNGKLHSTHPTKRAAKKMMGGMINDDDPTENDEEQIYDHQQVVDQAARDQAAGEHVNISNIEEEIHDLEQYLQEKLVVDPTGNLVEQLIANGYIADELIDMDLSEKNLFQLQQSLSPLTEQQQIRLIRDQINVDMNQANRPLPPQGLDYYSRRLRNMGFSYLDIRCMSHVDVVNLIARESRELNQQLKESRQMRQHDPKTPEHDDKRRK